MLFSSLGRREAGDTERLFAAYLAKPLRQSQLFDTLVGLLAHDAARAGGRAAPAKPTLDPGMAARHPLRILLAEDNVVNQKLALRLLQQMGYRADLARNGIEAIESRRAPDLRRGADGRADARDGRPRGDAADHRALARGERPRIVAMTANAMQGDREVCLAAGMDDYVTKPIRVDALVEALNQAYRARGADDMTATGDRSRPTFAELQASAGAEFVAELVDTFLEEAPRMLAELRDARAAGARRALPARRALAEVERATPSARCGSARWRASSSSAAIAGRRRARSTRSKPSTRAPPRR